MTHPIEDWHDYMRRHDGQGLDAMLAEDAVFESPVVFTPQRGKAIVKAYLGAAAKVLGSGSFRYVGEWRGENSAILEFENEIEGVHVNGIDMIWWNDNRKITRFKVMVRPLQAVNKLHEMMGAQLAKGKSAAEA